MKAINYILKNLYSLNFTILSQLLADEGVSLTENIRNYLFETPGNTNLSILKDFGIDISFEEEGEEEEDEVIFYYAEDSEYFEEYQSYPLKADAISENEAWFYGEVNKLKFRITIEVSMNVETREYSITAIKDGIYESTEEEIPEDVMQKIERKVEDFPAGLIKACIGEPQE